MSKHNYNDRQEIVKQEVKQNRTKKQKTRTDENTTELQKKIFKDVVGIMLEHYKGKNIEDTKVKRLINHLRLADRGNTSPTSYQNRVYGLYLSITEQYSLMVERDEYLEQEY